MEICVKYMIATSVQATVLVVLNLQVILSVIVYQDMKHPTLIGNAMIIVKTLEHVLFYSKKLFVIVLEQVIMAINVR